jgi:hypothetical protein
MQEFEQVGVTYVEAAAMYEAERNLGEDTEYNETSNFKFEPTKLNALKKIIHLYLEKAFYTKIRFNPKFEKGIF